MFHWKNGWYFVRTADGSVSMTHHDEGKPDDVQETIPAESWASIVAAVSVRGDTRETWLEALALHNQKPPRA